MNHCDQSPLTSNINPYRPAPETPRDHPSSNALSFDGVIGEDDYIDLLPRNLLIWWLNLILAILLIPAILLVSGIAVYSMVAGRNDAPTFVMIGLLGLLGAMSFVSVRTLGASYRGRRHLRRHPDLVGMVRGTLDATGLSYFDGVCTLWFAPAWLVGARASAKGIRIPKDADPYRYLALTSRLFDGYSVKVAERLVEQWTKMSSATEDTERWMMRPFDNQFAEPWTPTDDASENSVRFSGWVKTERPTKSPESRTKAWIETSSILSYGAGAVIAWYFGSMLLMIVLLLFMSVAVVSSIKKWRQYATGIQTETWNQAGWISENSLAWRTEASGIHLPLDQFVSASVTPELASFTDREGRTYMIPREQVASESQWDALSDRVQRLAIGPSGNESESGNTHSDAAHRSGDK